MYISISDQSLRKQVEIYNKIKNKKLRKEVKINPKICISHKTKQLRRNKGKKNTGEIVIS